MIDAKVCTQCSESKQLSDFNKNKNHKDGLECACRDCRKIYTRAYRVSNKDKILAKNKAWREANPAYNKAWIEANSEKVLAYNKAWREANADKMEAYGKAWREANPDRTAAIYGKGLATRRGGSASDIYDLELCIPFYEEARRLSKDTGVLHHVDHIIPISKGGLHCQTNLQVLTAFDNFQKGNSVGQSH